MIRRVQSFRPVFLLMVVRGGRVMAAEGRLIFFIWSEYLPPKVVDEFEERHGSPQRAPSHRGRRIFARGQGKGNKRKGARSCERAP